MKFGRFVSLGLMALVLSACQSFSPDHCHGEDCLTDENGVRASANAHAHDHDHSHEHKYSKTPRSNSEGLIVGAVMNADGSSALATYERWRYADQLASHILQANPGLRGSIDSYQYLSRRVGKPLGPILQRFRQDGQLNGGDLDALKSAQLRRRYLMLASILPNEEALPLEEDAEPLVGPLNREVHDYYDLKRQTVLLTSVRVQIYDTYGGGKIFDQVVRSDDGGRMLARETRSRQYRGNSLLASISNTIANGLTGSVAGAYPAPPAREDVLGFIWGRVAEKLPGDIASR